MKSIFLILVLIIGLFGNESEEIGRVYDINQFKKNVETKSIDSLLLKVQSDVYMKSHKNKDKGKGKLYLDFRKPRKGNMSHYIQNIRGKIGNKIFLDAYYSKNFHAHIFYFSRIGEYFYFKNVLVNSEYIDYEIVDNYGNSVKNSFKIKKYKKSLDSEIPNIKNNLMPNINSKVWEETKIEKIINLLYGESTLKNFHQEKYKNIIRKFNSSTWKNSQKNSIYHFRYSPIYFKFETTKDIESVALLYTGYKNPLLAVYNFYPSSVPYLRHKFYLPRSGKIIVLAKKRDGSFYMSQPCFIDLDRIKSAEDDDSTGLYFTIE